LGPTTINAIAAMISISLQPIFNIKASLACQNTQ
jgi:hypothetical protein